jgi:hypothetical protein
MEALLLSRKWMAELLFTLKGVRNEKFGKVLLEAWMEKQGDKENGNSLFSTYVSSYLPPIYEKLIRTTKTEIGLSLNEIVALGNQIEYSAFSTTAVQNWVKRDLKVFIGSPQLGKKYSIDQAAILYIVEDLKTVLDFESICNLLKINFNKIEDPTDDVINPLYFYSIYASVFEELHQMNDHLYSDTDFWKRRKEEDILKHVKDRIDWYISSLTMIDETKREAVKNSIFIAVTAVKTAYLQSLSRRYFNAVFISQK